MYGMAPYAATPYGDATLGRFASSSSILSDLISSASAAALGAAMATAVLLPMAETATVGTTVSAASTTTLASMSEIASGGVTVSATNGSGSQPAGGHYWTPADLGSDVIDWVDHSTRDVLNSNGKITQFPERARGKTYYPSASGTVYDVGPGPQPNNLPTLYVNGAAGLYNYDNTTLFSNAGTAFHTIGVATIENYGAAYGRLDSATSRGTTSDYSTTNGWNVTRVNGTTAWGFDFNGLVQDVDLGGYGIFFMWEAEVASIAGTNTLRTWHNGNPVRKTTGVATPQMTNVVESEEGCRSQNNDHGGGRRAERWKMQRGATDAEVLIFQGYLANKWWGSGTNNPLAAAHMFKNAAPYVNGDGTITAGPKSSAAYTILDGLRTLYATTQVAGTLASSSTTLGNSTSSGNIIIGANFQFSGVMDSMSESATGANLVGFTQNKTLDPMSEVASGYLNIAASAATTLQNTTLLAYAQVSSIATGGVTLGPMIPSATLLIATGVKGSTQLDPMTETATAQEAIAASGNVVLAPLVRLATATANIVVSGTTTLGNMIVSAVLANAIQARSTTTLAALSESGTLQAAVQAVSNGTLGSMSANATAVEAIRATVASTLHHFRSSGIVRFLRRRRMWITNSLNER